MVRNAGEPVIANLSLLFSNGRSSEMSFGKNMKKNRETPSEITRILRIGGLSKELMEG